MDTYGSFDRLVDAFRDFADRVPFYGAVVACIDDPAVRGLVPSLSRRVITYGFSEDADVRGVEPTGDGRSAGCRVVYRVRGVPHGSGEGRMTIPVPGRHNLQNALAATAVGLELGVPFAQIQGALADFRGAERRYQVRGTKAGVTVVDDYGHHPMEIAAVLRAAREGRPSRLIGVFQPHRYSRTRDLLGDFGPALAQADIVVLTDIYAAGERAIPGVTVEALAAAIQAHVPRLVVARHLDEVPGLVAGEAQPGDLVITLGAGSIAGAGDRILAALSASEVAS
jgi:UDP-N-acetylmuramate--alanine ligase